MVKTTRAQRLAIKSVFDRRSIWTKGNPSYLLSYRDFRKGLQPTFGCDGAVALPWCGMWLCIERDGYVHS